MHSWEKTVTCDEAGQLLRMTGTISDITQRKQPVAPEEPQGQQPVDKLVRVGAES